MIKSTKAKFLRAAVLLIFFALFCLLGGCGGSKGEEPVPTDTTAASLLIAASPVTVKTNNVTQSTITVTALNASLNSVSGVAVTISTDNGVLAGAQNLVTDSSGKVTATFSSGTDSDGQINRTATITAKAGTVSAQIPIQIVGSSVTLISTATTVSDDGVATATITATAKNASNSPVEGASVTFTSTGTGSVTITPASGLTDVNGQVSATVTGTGAGSVTLTSSALGATASKDITVSAAALTFAIDQQKLNSVLITNNTTTAMTTADALEVRVNAPSSTNVIFATTIGVWNGLTNVESIAVSGGKATATLTTTQAGVANVQVYDQTTPTTSDTLKVGITSGNPAYKITLQTSSGVVPKSVGTTTGSAILTARVVDALGYPVGNAPVSFRIINPTSGGENVSPVVVWTLTTQSGDIGAGEARTTFTSGSLSSGQGPDSVQIRATVVGTSVETEAWGLDATSSGNDAAIVIGGTAGSIAFGQATVLTQDPDTLANYRLPMSVLVADSNGNPVAGATVSLSTWPIAWSTGASCAYDADDGATKGTFKNEDVNENLILDTIPTPEDGTRIYYYTGVTALLPGKKDNQLTPPQADAGLVPSTVTTNANGVAAFNLSYGKNYSIWTVTRIRASTILQQGNSAISSQIIFRLAPLISDVTPNCLIPPSPYEF